MCIGVSMSEAFRVGCGREHPQPNAGGFRRHIHERIRRKRSSRERKSRRQPSPFLPRFASGRPADPALRRPFAGVLMGTIREFRRPGAVVSSPVHAACLPGAADALDAANLQKDAR